MRIHRNRKAAFGKSNRFDVGDLIICSIVKISAKLQQVNIRTAIDQCGTLSADDGVIASATDDTVCTCTSAVQAVSSGATDQRVIEGRTGRSDRHGR